MLNSMKKKTNKNISNETLAYRFDICNDSRLSICYALKQKQKTKIETFSLVVLYINISSRKFTIESVCREKTLVRQNVNSQFETERAYNRKEVLPLIEMLQMTINKYQLSSAQS